jgi:hypothetical protein
MFGRTKQKTSEQHDEPGLRCSFCNKTQNDVRKLIAGPTVNICDECVQTCVDIMADDAEAEGQRTASDGAAAHETSENSHLLGSACALCGLPLVLEEALPIDERGFLCPGCADAVEAAIAKRRLKE